MTLAEALASIHIHRVASLTGDRPALVTTRPCCAPPHTISDVGLIGGGQVPMPGEVSLAHNGVLCLDELPECRRHVLEVLRQPLEKSISKYNLPRVIDLAGLAAIGVRRVTPTRSREPW
jgi:magnesium chelatase family protein